MSYEYGCAMLYFDFPEMNQIHAMIDPSDVYEKEGDETYGLSSNPHCTLLYGFHKEVQVEQVKDALDQFKFTKCMIHNSSVFTSEEYDVLKFDVENSVLYKVNEKLKQFPHTTKYPDYHPHCTIGYLKSGCGKKYAAKLKNFKYEMEPMHAVFSHADGTKTNIPIHTKRF